MLQRAYSAVLRLGTSQETQLAARIAGAGGNSGCKGFRLKSRPKAVPMSAGSASCGRGAERQPENQRFDCSALFIFSTLP